MQPVHGRTNVNVSESPEADLNKPPLRRSPSLRQIPDRNKGIDPTDTSSSAQPDSVASAAPTLKKRSLSPTVFAGHQNAEKLRDALATFTAPKSGKAASASVKAAACLLAQWPDSLVFSSQEARLSFALELAVIAPGNIVYHLYAWNFADDIDLQPLAMVCGDQAILQHEKFSGWRVDWFAVYQGLAKNLRTQIDPDALELLPELITDTSQRQKLVKSLMRICPAQARDLVCECGFSEKERLELALVYFSSPETAFTEDLEAFDLQDPDMRATAALASIAAAGFNDVLLRKYILQIQPEEFALATLALAEMRLDQKLSATRGPLVDGLLSKKIRERFDKQELREELRNALKPLRQASSPPELRALLAEHADTLDALLGGKDIRTWDFDGASDEKARLFGLRNLVFFIEISGLGVSGNDSARADAAALLSRLGPALLKIGAIVDAGLRMDLLGAIFNLPRRCLTGFATADVPVHIQPACLLLSAMKLTRLPRLLQICSDEFKRDVPASRLLRLLLQLHKLESRVPNLEQLLEIVTPDLQEYDLKSKLDQDQEDAKRALSEFKRSANKDKTTDQAKANELAQKLKEAKDKVQANAAAFRKWKKETASKTLLALTRLTALLESGGEAAAGMRTRQALEALHADIVESALGVTPDQYDRYLALTDKWRDPSTLLVYYNRIKDTSALAPLREFVQQCLAQQPALQFREKRYADVPILKSCSEQTKQAWMLNVQQPLSAALALAFTDDPEDLARMGSDMPGSCQKIDGLPVLNRALIGAVMDGREKLVVIKAEDGTILGRAILRLMASNPAAPGVAPAEAEGQPYLLMEKIYPLTLSRDRKVALVNFALKQAQRIGFALQLSQAVWPRPAPNAPILHSGELEHILYSDAAGGLQADAFTITDSTPLTDYLTVERAGALL